LKEFEAERFLFYTILLVMCGW